MIKQALWYLPIVFLALAACAGEPDADAPQGVHVNIANVVERGTVTPVDGITSAGQPSADALRVFADSGYVAVVDLRGPKEKRGLDEQAVVAELGLDYVKLPLVGADAINFDNAKRLDEVLAAYDGPVLLHCGSGNRVGAVLALRESLNGADDDEALQYGKSAGLSRLERVVKKRLAED